MIGVRRWVSRWWSGKGGRLGTVLSVATAALEWKFRWVSNARIWAYDAGVFRSFEAAIPVISVGNLSVGGTGKTPLVGWITRTLLERDRRPVVVRRRYGDDETLLHQRWNPSAFVVADSDRLEGIRRAVLEGADVAVLDDGFQHLRIRRALDLVIISCEQGLEGRCLPRGPFREGPEALARAGLVIVGRRNATEAEAQALVASVRERFPSLPMARVMFRSASWTDLAGAQASAPVGDVLAVSSIGDDRSFLAMVRERHSGGVEPMAFADHHPYARKDIDTIRRRAGARAIVTTEKDAVKLTELETHIPGVRVLPMEVLWEEGETVATTCIRKAVEAGPLS